MSDKLSFDVLDHGYVKHIDHMGTDSSIIEAARMSTGRGFEGWEKDAGLLDFLYRHKHTSPFEMCELAIEVQAPLFVIREWERHRTQSYNEFSARYSKMDNLHYLPAPERVQSQSATNKQGSDAPVKEQLALEFIEDLRDEQEYVYRNYDTAVEVGVAKELARINTPVSRYSRFRAKANLLNWFRFLNLRMRPNAQMEIRVFAEAVAKIIKELWPRSYELFERYDLMGVSFSAEEMNAIRALIALPMRERHGLTGSKLKEFMNKIEVGGKVIL